MIPEATAVWLPKSVINRWPATMFAINRTARVSGRIIFLMDSINTIKGIKAPGVLWGTKWANICFVWFSHPYNIKEIHRGILNVMVRAIWLEAVKIYGNRPIKLLIKIKIKRATKGVEDPLNDVGPSNVLNSSWSLLIIDLSTKKNLFGVIQKIGVNKVKKIIELIQLNGIFIIAVGSKTENKLVIIIFISCILLSQNQL